jgi:hypothetical protein
MIQFIGAFINFIESSITNITIIKFINACNWNHLALFPNIYINKLSITPINSNELTNKLNNNINNDYIKFLYIIFKNNLVN